MLRNIIETIPESFSFLELVFTEIEMLPSKAHLLGKAEKTKFSPFLEKNFPLCLPRKTFFC